MASKTPIQQQHNNKTMGRLLENVHDAIMAAIPETEVGIRNALQNYIDTIWNKAPEVRQGPEVYGPYTDILVSHICANGLLVEGEDAEWKFVVQDIFNGRTGPKE